MGLRTEEMREVATVFQGAYEHTITNFVGSEIKAAALQFVAGIVLSEKPYMLVTEEGFARAVLMVFSNEVARDFVLMLGFTFFSRWGGSQEQYVQLIENLSYGAGHVDGAGEYAGMPVPISQRLTSAQEAAALLQANRWLVVLLLMQLFLVLPDTIIDNANKQ